MKGFVFIIKIEKSTLAKVQRQSPRGVLLNRCSADLHEICGKTPMWKCKLKKVAIVEHLCEKRGAASDLFTRKKILICLNPFMPDGSKRSY